MATCLNDEWEVNDAHVCQPKPEHFNLQCDANGMSLEVSNKLFPAAKDVFLQDNSCVATFDAGTEVWSINTMLDGCGTSLTTNDDGTLVG